jgi:hypothetical protein
VSPPSSGKEHAYFMLVSHFVHSSTLELEVTYYSETSSNIQWTTWLYIPEDRNVHNHCRVSLRFEKVYFLSLNNIKLSNQGRLFAAELRQNNMAEFVTDSINH